ncbi:MAG: hypothetical protein IJ719_21975 [Clostridia bacterium]|nr:hypothetical protein [Clostridia bacterium]
MRAIAEQSRLEQIDETLNIIHSEITCQLSHGEICYVQAHDNGTGRYYVLSRVSYFAPEREEEDEDILEEYHTDADHAQEEDPADQDFFRFLDSWHQVKESSDDAPYIASDYAPLFDMADTLLDHLSGEFEEQA